MAEYRLILWLLIHLRGTLCEQGSQLQRLLEEHERLKGQLNITLHQFQRENTLGGKLKQEKVIMNWERTPPLSYDTSLSGSTFPRVWGSFTPQGVFCHAGSVSCWAYCSN